MTLLAPPLAPLWALLLVLLLVLGAARAYCVPGCECESTDEGLRVDCSARNLTHFPLIPDELLNQVASLDLSQNVLSFLPDDPPRLASLHTLSLAANSLERLPRRWLRGLPQLRRLDLSANTRLPLHALGDEALNYARVLQTLNMSQAEVEDDMERAARSLRSGSLEVLDLSWRRLPEVRGTLLGGLTSLRSLDLSGNPLHLLVGLKLRKLEELSLVRTKLDSLTPAMLLDLPQLRKLDVSGNRGFAFPDSGAELSPSLTELRARFCELRLQSLKAFPNLKYANLQHNGVMSVWNTSFDHKELTELDLSNNNIHRIHQKAFTNLPQLQRINLANNKIMELHADVFATNEFLVAINLSSNPIAQLEEMRAESLASLDLSQCSIGELSSHNLIKMPMLHTLNLSANRLERLPDNLTSSSLQALDLSYCRLASVGDSSFRQLPALQWLGLAGNRLTEPPRASVFAKNMRLRTLLLRDNPWRCDCDSYDFRNAVEYVLNIDQQEASKSARCASPSAVEGSSWLQACFDEWYPEVERGAQHRYGATVLSVVAVCGGVILLVSAVRGAVRRRRKRRERRRQEEIERRLQVRERELRQQLRSELDDDDDDIFGASRRPEPRRTPSTLTQPPTYEEALLLSRSQQDLLGAPAAGASSATVGSATVSAAAVAAGVAAQTAVSPSSVTCARHILYEVDVEPIPKPKPAKPPRKSGKRTSSVLNGEGLSHVPTNPGESASPNTSITVQIEVPPNNLYTSSPADGAAPTIENTDGGRLADDWSRGDQTPATLSHASGVSVANATLDPPAYDAGAGSEASSALSTPAPRRQRPLSAYSSDASAEDSDEPPAPR